MRRGEYDEFDDHDLIREFGKYGVVTKAEMTIDKENGWSRGFGFVSLATVAEAEAAIEGVNGQWLAGREMKVEEDPRQLGVPHTVPPCSERAARAGHTVTHVSILH